MNGDLREISMEILGDVSEKTRAFASVSHPLYEGSWQGQRVCLIGFIPFPDRAYVWMDTYPIAEQHKIAIGRWARRLIPEIRKRYPVLVGHCWSGSERWLRSLGAEILEGEFAIHG